MHDGYAANPSATDVGWYREDTRVGGGVTLTTNFGGAPSFGGGSLALTTNNQNSAKAQLFTSDDVRGKDLITIGATSYSTYHSSLTGTVNDDPSYQLRIDLDGDLSTTSDQTNLVYEPYWNDTETGIGGGMPQHPEGLTDDTWQQWNTTNGTWWSSKQIGNANGSSGAPCGSFHIEPGAGGPPFTTPGQVGTGCPGAKVVKIGLNVGSSNPTTSWPPMARASSSAPTPSPGTSGPARSSRRRLGRRSASHGLPHLHSIGSSFAAMVVSEETCRTVQA